MNLYSSFNENIKGKLSTYLIVSRRISNLNRFKKSIVYSFSKDVQYYLNNSLHSDSVPKRKKVHTRKLEIEHSKSTSGILA